MNASRVGSLKNVCRADKNDTFEATLQLPLKS
jgi:hypothetical protein